MNTYCQSCSMPLANDPERGGSEEDGSKSETYCSNCYENGAFKQPDMTLSDMQALCMEKVKERGVPSFLAWIFTRRMHKLARWSKN